jgi:histidyl-tRNA synthetase
MDFQAVKGTRDFYPAEMAVRNYLVDAWRRVSLRNGFEEFDGPVLEYLDLYRVKSGDEIVSQLFAFTDRGGRQLAMRPEMTPTLARMINARVNSLPRPIKWFCLSNVFRAENPQRGRSREFFQWNIDIIGSDQALADAEGVFVAVDLLAELGLASNDVVVRYSSRRLLAAVLTGLGLAADAIPAVLAVLDKRGKLPDPAFAEMLEKVVPAEDTRESIRKFLDLRQMESAEELAADLCILASEELRLALEDLRQFQQALRSFGIEAWCRYDTGIVRGLAYYTGIVYEIYDRSETLRALAGGGRYDNLLEVLGGPKIGATGFGMGDVVLGILLAEKGKLPDLASRLDCFVVTGEAALQDQVLQTVGALRRGGVATDFSPKARNLSKLLKDAAGRRARYAVIVRAESLAVKNLTTGEQIDVPAGEFLRQPKKFLA